MFQRPDYTILDPLAEICEVVGYNLCYLYVNDAAAEWEHVARERMIGRPLAELHPEIESSRLFRHLQKCLEKRQPVEFEDRLPHSGSAGIRWKIRIDPVREGALLHVTKASASRTKSGSKEAALAAGTTDAHPPEPAGPGPAYYSASLDPSRDLQIEGWLDDLDTRTRESMEHIHRVAEATVALARMVSMPESEIFQIRRGALLHDIGKIGVPDAILLKPGKLTDEEWETVCKHPIYAYELFYPIEYLRNCLAIPYSHHERWDGTGYPRGLKGEEIPLPARLFAVVEVWDTLSCDRVYGKAWPREKIMQYIQEQSGFHFDPEIVDLFVKYVTNP
jgi:HD-GYP domain-containing protein (c-di-GMP phosphodiesterase class II)